MEDEINQWCPTDPITCKECGRTFDHPTKLTRHEKIHSNRKQRPASLKYYCLYCEKVFASRNHLSQHAAMHTSRKEYPCDFCNARFGSPSFLNTHKMLLHKGKKLPMREGPPQDLVSHSNNEMKSYGVKKQHKCTVCGSDFALESSLARHMCLTHQLDNGGQFHEHITMRRNANRTKIPNRPTANAVVDGAAHTETNSRSFVMLVPLLDKSPSGVRIASALEQQSCRSENFSGPAQNDMYGSDEHAAMLVLPQFFDANNDTAVGLKPDGHIRNNNVFPFIENSNAHTQNNDFSYGASEATFLLPHFVDADANDDADIDQKPFVCQKCGDIFSLKANLDEHMTAHVENDEYHCDREGTETSTDVCAYSVEPIEQKPYRCDICGDIFPLLVNLQVHHNTHT